MKKNILIVDDDPSIRALLAFVLKKNYMIKTLNSVDSAIGWLKEGNNPSLIITDASMPKVTGEEFVGFLRTSLFFNKIPIIVLSALNKTSDRLKFYQKGADEYLTKPFDPAELNNRIEYLLSK